MRDARDKREIGRKALHAMKTLKLALVTASAASAVAAAGGITYAAVGHSTPVKSAQSGKNLSMVKDPKLAPKAPAVPVPTCLPKLPGGKLPTGKLPTGKLPTGKLPTDKLPTGKLPTGKLPIDKLPKVPGGVVPSQLPKVPGGVPSTLPTDKLPNLPTCTGDVTGQPKPGLPGLPKPGLPKTPDCSALPPAINLQDGKSKEIALPTGAHLAFAHTHYIHVDGRQFCANTEKFVGIAGGFLTIERLQTPPQVTLSELANGLDLTKGNVASVNGTDMWRSPAGDGMLWYSNKGYAIYLNGSPALQPLLPGISSQLRAQ